MRRLMAIVVVDVVGYSRLMSHDEDGTLVALRELRTLIDPIFESGGGRIVKSTGDGILVEAASVVRATRAAIEVQRVVGGWNAGRPEVEHMRLRIGVNLGDVDVDETGDIYGDGVNVAARLEGLATPGGICLSDAAYQQVKGRVDAPLRDMGEQRVKNIPTPIRVWAIGAEGTSARAGRRRRLVLPLVVTAVLAVTVIAALLLDSGAEPEAATTAADPGSTTAVLSVGPEVWTVEFDSEVQDMAAAGEFVVVSLADGAIQAVSADGDRWPSAFVASGEVSSLVASAERAFIGVAGSRVIRAINVSDGSEAWRTLLELESTSSALLAHSDGVIYAALGFGVARLDEEDGTVDWETPVVISLPIEAISADESLLAVSDGRFVYGLDPTDGSFRWQVGPPQIGGGALWIQAWVIEVDTGFSKVLEERVLVVTGDLELVVINGRSGSVVWSVPVTGVPAVTDTSVIVLSVDGETVALSIEDGFEKWRRDDILSTGTPILHAGRVLVVSGDGLLALNSRSGTTTGSATLATEPTGALVSVGELVVFPAGSRLIAVTPPS